jgi:hypothetical protein
LADMRIPSIGKNTPFAPKSLRQEIFILAKQLPIRDLGHSLRDETGPPKCEMHGYFQGGDSERIAED